MNIGKIDYSVFPIFLSFKHEFLSIIVNIHQIQNNNSYKYVMSLLF
jgi:hypothetical protein